MSRLTFVSDLHLSSKTVLGRPRLPVGAQFLADLIGLVQSRSGGPVFFLGDTIDAKNDLQALLLLHRFIMAAKKVGISVTLLGGNHEVILRSDPTNSVLTLLSGVSDVVLLPRVLRLPDATLFFAPWAQESTFIGNCEKLAAIATKTEGRKILLAHVGVKEGRIGASNIMVPQRVSIKDLHPGLYDLVLLGDYHVHQQVAENAYYLGAPYQHQFGDEGTVGSWLVDTDTCEMEGLVLPHPPPCFVQHRIVEPWDLDLPGYSDADYNRIHTTSSLAETVRLRYPDADIRLIDEGAPEKDPDLSGSRLSAQASLDPTILLQRYLEACGRQSDDALFKTGCELLEEAAKG